MAALTSGQKNFMRLVARSGAPGDWCKVSDVVAPVVRMYATEIPELVEYDEENKMARLTQEGCVVLEYT